MAMLPDEYISKFQGLLSQIQSEGVSQKELRKYDIDLTGFCLPGSYQIQSAAAVAILPAPIVGLGFLVAFLIASIVLLYILAHVKDIRQVVLAMIEAARELTQVKERVKKLPEMPRWNPKCDPNLQNLMQIIGKILVRVNSQAARSPGPEFMKGIFQLGEEFMRALQDLMRCLGVNESSPEWHFLVGEKGVIKVTIGYVKKILYLKPKL